MARSGTNHKGGRPRGKKNAKTIAKETALEALQNEIIKQTKRIMRAFFFNIDGLTHVYRIDEKKGKPDEHVLLEDPKEIEQALNQIYGGEKNGGDNAFYYVQSKDPDWRAAESLLNRAHGRPTETNKLIGTGDKGEIVIQSFRDGK